MVKKSNISLDFAPKDKKFLLKQIIDKSEIALKQRICVNTDFLDPYEVKLSTSILNNYDELSYRIDGGYENAERKAIYFYPSYMNMSDENRISMLSFLSLSEIKHKDVLGALLSLGLERKKIGGIVVNKDYTYIFVMSDISDYIYYNLDKIGNKKVEFVETDFQDEEIEYEEKTIIVSSLRLDSFVSAILNLSRSRSINVIKSGYVKLNFKEEQNPSLKLSEGDIVSIRKFGRVIFYELIGNTKKENFILKVKIPKWKLLGLLIGRHYGGIYFYSLFNRYRSII